jgi:arylsulfatase A-like enzyme
VLLLTLSGFLFFKGRRSGEKEPKDTGSWNVLLITLDTTRADRLGCYGYQNGWTPNLDYLVASGVRFQNAYCQVPLTLPSHASILTGLHPCRHGVHNNGNYALSPHFTTLAEILQE